MNQYNSEDEYDDSYYNNEYGLIGNVVKNKGIKKDSRVLVKKTQQQQIITDNNILKQKQLKYQKEKERKIKIEEGKKRRALECELRKQNKNITKNTIHDNSIIYQQQQEFNTSEEEVIDNWEKLDI